MTKGVQLRWLRKGLLYNRWFFIFENKEAYTKDIQYELKLRNHVLNRATQQEL